MGKVVGFGEVMARLSAPGYLKVIQAEQYNVSYAGAEANVCVSLSRFGLETEFVTKAPDNDVTQSMMMNLRKFGVGLRHVVLGGDRLGVYYIERGASQRPSKVTYDRKYSAVSMASREDFDWERIFEGASWFHFTGITAGLSDAMPAICEDACKAAKAKGITISCDLNYRKLLWTPQKAKVVMSHLVTYVDVLIGNEEDAETTLGMKPEGTDITKGKLDYDAYTKLASAIAEKFGCKSVAFTLRGSLSASDNKWAALLYTGGKSYFSKEYLIHLVDRVGGGDSFSAGLIFALYSGYEPQDAVEFAVAASCLKQTIESDFNLSTVQDVKNLVGGDGSGRVQR